MIARCGEEPGPSEHRGSATPSWELADLVEVLRSPASGARLRRTGNGLESESGDETFPLVGEVPILLDDSTSAFSTEALLTAPSKSDRRAASVRRAARIFTPDLSPNLAAGPNLRRLLIELGRDGPPPFRILTIGGSMLGHAMETLSDSASVTLVETDVAHGPRTQIVCDAHSLPFASGTFDAVVAQAVLEHVADPQQVVSELHRVLRPGGLVYSEIPFMQQVHEGANDFTRYTLVGHRRLFRRFDCLDLGLVAGPATALAWTLKYACLAFTEKHVARLLIAGIMSYLLFWMKYLDRWLIHFPASADAASATYFLGRTRASALSDREILASFGASAGGFRRTRG